VNLEELVRKLLTDLEDLSAFMTLVIVQRHTCVRPKESISIIAKRLRSPTTQAALFAPTIASESLGRLCAGAVNGV
jgi:hypothetical protein